MQYDPTSVGRCKTDLREIDEEAGRALDWAMLVNIESYLCAIEKLLQCSIKKKKAQLVDSRVSEAKNERFMKRRIKERMDPGI